MSGLFTEPLIFVVAHGMFWHEAYVATE
jgi:hypothetical protein